MGQLGLPELIIIGLIALLIFGPKKLPDLGAGLGKAIRDFKGAMTEKEPPAKEETKEEKKLKSRRRLQPPRAGRSRRLQFHRLQKPIVRVVSILHLESISEILQKALKRV